MIHHFLTFSMYKEGIEGSMGRSNNKEIIITPLHQVNITNYLAMFLFATS